MILNQTTKPLPIGQKEIKEFPRFGMSQYAKRCQENFGPIDFEVSGEVVQPFRITLEELGQLNKSEMISDFHCVTTWTKCNLKWGGYRFVDFFEKLIRTNLISNHLVHWVFLKFRWISLSYVTERCSR